MRIFILVVGIIAFAWFGVRADPRPTFNEGCSTAAVNSADRNLRTNAAFAGISFLARNADDIYGPVNRAKQRLLGLGDSFGYKITDPAFGIRVSAGIEELGLMHNAALALDMSVCSTQHLVPDHRSDSVGSARAKLLALMRAL